MTGLTTGAGPDTARARAATERLGHWVSTLDMNAVDDTVSRRLALVLLDVVGVTALGAVLDEHRALRSAWDTPPGPAPLVGAGRHTTVDAAAWLNATALVALELDEGNKYAKGHPAAHGFPAVLALAAQRDSSGAETAAALLAAYEVAARFGRATRLVPGAHPHGSWGVAGAAAGCARLLGLGPRECAAAIDTAAGMPIAGHFDSALDGNVVRDAWIGAANTSGLAAARLAAAGVARNTGTAALSLGMLLGEFDPDELVTDLGRSWQITRGYLKRHASCSFTHPAADAVLRLREHGELRDVRVETHALGAGLARTDWDNRLSAMFSTPFVVAVAALTGEVGPSAYAPERLTDERVRSLARRVHVVPADDLTARLPDERAVRVTARYTDGSARTVEVPNPVGDADHHPLIEADVVAMLAAWLPERSAVLEHAVRLAHGLPALPRTGEALRALAGDEEVPECVPSR
ncbi:MmgE/PrpD family protein [Saccharomonospora azurea]